MKNINEHADRRMENIRLRRKKTRKKYTVMFVQLIIIALLWNAITQIPSYKAKSQEVNAEDSHL